MWLGQEVPEIIALAILDLSSTRVYDIGQRVSEKARFLSNCGSLNTKGSTMKTNMLLIVIALLARSVLAADAPKDEITSAAKKLGEKANYSWKTTVVVPEGSQFRPGPTEGKTQKDGLTLVSWTFGDSTTDAVIKGEKAAVNSPDEGWQSLAELDSAEGRGRFVGFFVRNLRTPAVQAAELASASKDLKKDGDAYSGELTEEGAKVLLSFRRRGADAADAPTVSGAQGSVRFWLKEGALVKYEFKVKGTVSFNGNDRDVDRATTVEIKDVGTTKLDVPDEAKKKL